ncbi:MAG: alpha/beta hydrolase [Cytophagales bacterium]|nr:alpha/beta hydrolase [Cytophagales bacterium]MDW8383430.1 alpha/beta hydrolase [Flammeovirgaceae bacterium]
MLYHKTYVLSEKHDWVVLIHGAGGSSSIWFKQLRAYQEHFNVLLVDLRGHGKSKETAKEYSNRNYSFRDVSYDVIEVLDYLNIQKAHFVGISLGCIVIRTIGEIAPERIKSMVLGGAVTRLNTRSKILMFIADTFKRVVPFIWLYQFFAYILMPRKRHEESRNLFVKEAKRLANKEFLRWLKLTAEVNPLLRYFTEVEIPVPTLYLMGEEDYMFLPQVKNLIKKHKHAVLEIFKECGHVVNVEKPELFNKFSIEFMKQISLASA